MMMMMYLSKGSEHDDDVLIKRSEYDDDDVSLIERSEVADDDVL